MGYLHLEDDAALCSLTSCKATMPPLCTQMLAIPFDDAPCGEFMKALRSCKQRAKYLVSWRPV